MRPMDLSSVQLRTLADLLDCGDGSPFPTALAGDLRRAIEEAIRPWLPPRPLRLWKERLTELARCEGLFDAGLKEERVPFEHTPATAAGILSHRSIELDVASTEEVVAYGVAERAAASLQRDRRFRSYWEGLGPLEQGELRMQAVRSLEQFRASFPPVRVFRRRLAPVTELWLEARFGGGTVSVLGKVDLLLNAAHPGRSTRVLIDLKGGRPRLEHAEDMRLYALLFTLRAGMPPYRVATFFLGSGEWQPEEITPELLEHAAGRVIGAVRAASELMGGRAPSLRGGRHCRRCPRSATCPAAEWPNGEENAARGA
jgi:PD-(D/E)XK nuclease superfamily protein